MAILYHIQGGTEHAFFLLIRGVLNDAKLLNNSLLQDFYPTFLQLSVNEMLKSNPQIKTYRIYVGYTYLQTFHPTFLQLGRIGFIPLHCYNIICRVLLGE